MSKRTSQRSRRRKGKTRKEKRRRDKRRERRLVQDTIARLVAPAVAQHRVWTQAGSVSGRASSSNPNIMSFPRLAPGRRI